MTLRTLIRAIICCIVPCLAMVVTPAFAQAGVPTVTSVSPSQGPTAGGTIVTITGSGFTAGTAVIFNRIAATNVQVLDASHLTVTTPPLGSGPFATALAAVRVSNASGAAYTEFLYKPLTFDEIRVGDITTIAGVGNFIGEGRLAPQAIVEAEAIAVDQAGNLYLGEETGGQVRKIGPDGRIITIAGTGAIGFFGDGGLATEAQFNWPAGVAVDRTGNIYVADAFGNNRVRKIDVSTGIVATIAGTGRAGYSGDGGPATQAQLNTPDSSVAVDAHGNVFVADQGNQRIRKIDASGIITTVAGNGVNGFSGDGGPAIQAAFGLLGSLTVDSVGNLYVVDFSNQRIRRIGANGFVSTIAGGGNMPPTDGAQATQINSIFDCVAIDSQDRLIFSTAARVWRLEANGKMTRIAGTGNLGLSPDGARALDAAMIPEKIAVAATGDIYISERAARRIRRIDAVSGILTTVAGIGPSTIGDGGSQALAAVFPGIGNIALDAAGNILEVDNSLRIRKINLAGMIVTVAGIGVAPIQGFYHEDVQALSAGISPASVQVDANGNTFFSDFCSVRRIGSDGAIRTVAGPITNNQLCGFGGDGGLGTGALLAAEQDTIKLDSQGNIFIADTFNHRVRRLDATTGIITSFAGSGPTGPNGYDPSAPPSAFAGDGGLATQALLSSPTDVAFDSKRNVCFADVGNFSVRCVDPQGRIRTVAGRGTNSPGDGGPGTGAILNPYRIAFDQVGNMYISDYSDATIRKLDINGTISTVAGVRGGRGFSGDGGSALQANIDYGSGLAVDTQGNILILDGANKRIRVIRQSIKLVASPNSAFVGQTITFSASVPTDATGSVVFFDGPTMLGSATVTMGGANFSTTALAAGTHTIIANYSGDTTHSASSTMLSGGKVLVVKSLPVPLSKRGGIDFDGSGKSQLVVRNNSGQMMAGRFANSTLTFSSIPDPGAAFTVIGTGDLDGNGKSDLVFQTSATDGSGRVTVGAWIDFLPTSAITLRAVKPAWVAQASADLDGDGFGDLAFRFTGDDGVPNDTGVSYLWFQQFSGIYNSVRKRGGAPLSWMLLGAIDLNYDGAADMIYISPQGQIKALMATPGRTCANLAAGTVPTGFNALKLADFTGNQRGDILIRDAGGNTQLISLDGTGLVLPPYTGNPDDINASCTASALAVGSSIINLPQSDPTWTYYASGDFNGDGIFDIVWKQPNGTLTVWLMNANGAPTVINNAGTAPVGYSPIPLQ